jgi:hypothetical protein
MCIAARPMTAWGLPGQSRKARVFAVARLTRRLIRPVRPHIGASHPAFRANQLPLDFVEPHIIGQLSAFMRASCRQCSPFAAIDQHMPDAKTSYLSQGDLHHDISRRFRRKHQPLDVVHVPTKPSNRGGAKPG